MYKLFSIVITLLLFVSCTSKTTENPANTTPEEISMPAAQPSNNAVTTAKTPLAYKDIVFTTMDLKEVKVSDFKGKRVLLNFWATWCRPCVMEMPSLNNAYKTLQNENYVFLAASNENVEKINAFAQRNKFDFQFIKADDQFRPFNIQVIPTTLVFDTNGELVTTLTGGMVWDDEAILKQLRSVK